MGRVTGISWCDHTFNPWYGCAKVSPGCKFCYAEHGTPARVERARGVEVWGPHAARKVLAAAGWAEPLRWDRAARDAGVRRRVFSLSQGDWLEDRPDLDEPLARLVLLTARTPNLDWLLLTKRPENFRRRLNAAASAADRCMSPCRGAYERIEAWLDGRPPANVWAGASVEDRGHADERIPELLKVPAAVRFLSVEPLLGPIDLTRLDNGGGETFNALTAEVTTARGHKFRASDVDPVGWIIAGGESGPKARPCDIAWLRSLRDQCRDAGVSYFCKQLGSNVEAHDIDSVDAADNFPGVVKLSPGSAFNRARVRLKDPKGGDIEEFPEDLRIRQFPEPRPCPTA